MRFCGPVTSYLLSYVILFFTLCCFVHIVGEQRYQKRLSGSKSWVHKIIKVSVGISRHFSRINTKSRYQWKGYLTLYLPLRFSPDSFIRIEVTGYNSIQCKSWGYSKLRTLQITKRLVPYLDLLNLLTQFHTEITPISLCSATMKVFQLRWK